MHYYDAKLVGRMVGVIIWSKMPEKKKLENRIGENLPDGAKACSGTDYPIRLAISLVILSSGLFPSIISALITNQRHQSTCV